MKVPWVWTRDKLAEIWGITPWEVDSVPWYEIELKLRLMEIEQEGRKRRQSKDQSRADAKAKAQSRRSPLRRRR